ncbi:hypothetical protein LJC69_05775, partial [Bacteroidales bacterium OttesenSCG-928-K22]|nr:hypothetical protein [Bacteroidales bacterium OttesenSCG-928-K22]
MKKLFLIIFTLTCIAVAITFILTSCEDTKNNEEIISAKPILTAPLKFTDNEEFSNTYDEIRSLTHEEREEWEKTNNFKSYGYICDELYWSLTPENFKSVDEVKEFVATNSEYLQLLEYENGEYTLETQLYNNPFRYMINANKIYYYGEYACKILSDGIIYTNINFVNQLLNINSKDDITNDQIMYEAYFIENIDDNDFENMLKDNSTVCKDSSGNPRYYEFDNSDGGERIHLRISILSYRHKYEHIQEVYGEYMARPFKRVLGVWYWCTRTYTYSLSVTVHDNYWKPWRSRTFSKGENNINASFRTGDFFRDIYSWPSDLYTNDDFKNWYHFGGWNLSS